MSWDFIYQPHTPHRYFWSATVMDKQEPDLWWSDEHKKFTPMDEMGNQGGSNQSPPIRTLRAFKRFLRKHPELKGRRVTLVSRYVGCDIEAVPK